jgi:glycerol uptake facilitator-like aquaporin
VVVTAGVVVVEVLGLVVIVLGVVPVVVEVLVPVAVGLVVSLGRVLEADSVETVELLLSLLLAITNTATRRPTITAINPAISRWVLP